MGDFLIPLGLICIPCTAILTVLYVSARDRAKRAETLLDELVRSGVRSGRGGADGARRLEDAVDAIALEVERISEAQRFTTRILTERREPAPYSQPLRLVTPH